MAFLVTSRLLMKQLIKSEKIFKNIVKVNSIFSNISDKYVAEIKNMKIDPKAITVTELLEFPSKTFYWIDKKSLEDIIHNSYNIIKEKGLATTPEVYKSILKTYLFDRIDFDVENLLKDMSENHIKLDQEIYNYIIRYYCNNRKMDVVEDLLRDMGSKGIGLDELMKLIIISGYTAAKQSEKSEIFIRENQLEPNGFDVLYSKCYGFACSGDMDNLKKILFEIKEKNFLLSAFHCKLIYSRLLSANVEKSSLDQIIDLTKENFNSEPNEFYQLVSRLNTENNFEISIYLIKKIIDAVNNSTPFISIFSTPRCPIEIFMEVLETLLNRRGQCSRHTNIFVGVTVDKAFEISEKFHHVKNWKIIHYSLINKAISEKSVPLIEKALNLTFSYLQWSQINLMFQESVIHLFLENEMVSNYEEILDIIPKYRKPVLSAILMEYLCTGDFNRYNKLRLTSEYPAYLVNTKGNYIPSLLVKTFTNKDIKIWAKEARKYFHWSLINQILAEFIVYKIIGLSKKNSLNEIEEVLGYVKEWNVKFLSWQLHFLLQVAPAHAELIQSLDVTSINHVKTNMSF